MEARAFGEGTVVFSRDLTKEEKARVRACLHDVIYTTKFITDKEIAVEHYRDWLYDEEGILNGLSELANICPIIFGDFQLTGENGDVWKFHYTEQQWQRYEAKVSFCPPVAECHIPVRDFLSLTREEVERIVTDIFQATKVIDIKNHSQDDSITCKVMLPLKTVDGRIIDNSVEHSLRLTLRNPYLNPQEKALDIACTVTKDDYMLFRKYCLAKGICPLLEDNPYWN